MNSSSFRATSAIALARRRLLTGSSLCTSEKMRLLRRYWVEGQVTAQAGAERWSSHCCYGQTKQRMMSTTNTLHARKGGKGGQQSLPYKSPIRKPTPQTPQPADPIPSKPPNSSRQRTFLTVSGVMAFGIAAYMAMLYSSYKKTVSTNTTLQIPADVSNRYDNIATKFDSDVDFMEKYLRIGKMRKQLVSQATGDVCEVSIGTGRNLTYYDWKFGLHFGKVGRESKIKKGTVRSFTAVDKSEEMLEVAHEKFGKEYPGILGVRWVIQDAAEPLPSPPVSANERSGNKIGKKYDTIIQTFGLCSTPDPVRLLKNLGESVEPDGKILLLEHGRGSYDWINNILDGLAPAHADRFGCWWNKDIAKIVEESDLDVVKIKRRHFGTTWWVELKPKALNKVEEKDKS